MTEHSAALFSAEGVDWNEILRRRDAATQPGSVSEWRHFAQSLLTDQSCVFHRNLEISALYASLYLRHPTLFKWAGMAALASFHVRTALLPYALEATRQGLVKDLSGGRVFRSLRLDDVTLLRETNNSIFQDIAWVHLAYDGSAQGLERLREAALEHEHYAQLLPVFERLERARKTLEVAEESEKERARKEIWDANRDILRHEQVVMVQPRFDRISRGFARLFSLGSTMAYHHEGVCPNGMRGMFYPYMVLHGSPLLWRTRSLPRMTRLEHRWHWIENGIFPAFLCFESMSGRLSSDLAKIFDELGALNEHKACSIRAVDAGQ